MSEQVDNEMDAMAIGLSWMKDSSLEKWFPMTAEQIAQLIKERDQLAAKCAEMREIVMMIKKYQWSERFLERISRAISDQCGVGWLRPDQKKVLVGLIQRCDDYLAGSASFLPTRTEFKQALEACK